jgi:hypothetical protein
MTNLKYYILWVFVALGIQHAMHMHCIFICGLSGSTSLRHDKKITEHKMYVSIFFTTFAWNISHFKKNCAGYDHKCLLVFMQSACYSSQILMKLEFSPQIFEKYSNIKFHENSPVGIKLFHADGMTRQDEANNRFSQFCECALKRNVHS